MRDHDIARGEASTEGAEPTAPGRRTQAAARYGGREATTIHDVATLAVEHKDGGRAVDGAVRARAESHLGADLSSVRVHDDPLAQQATAAMGARAFAHGGDVFLGPGESGGDVGLMAHELTHVVQQGAAGQRAPLRKVEVGAADSPAEREADQVASAVASGATPAAGTICDDDATPGPGQIPKRIFLDRLRQQVTQAADGALGPVWSALGCPYIESAFARYRGMPAAQVEALARRYSGGGTPPAAEGYLAPIVARVTAGVSRWRDGGDVSGDLAAAGLGDTAAAAQKAATAARGEEASDDPGAASAPPPNAAATASADGATASPGDTSAPGTAAPGAPDQAALLRGPAISPDGVAHALGPGTAPDPRTREIAGELGVDALRIHTGPMAARAAAAHGAAAFTVGHHVVFGEAEHQPGTPAGDALIAHEIAHVAQQTGSTAQLSARDDAAEPPAADAEADADQAAVGVMARLYGGVSRAATRANAVLRMPVSLQRCDKGKKPTPAPTVKGPEIGDTQAEQGKHIVDGMGALNSGGDLDKGVHYYYNYRSLCMSRDPSRWNDDYQKGFADPAFFTRTGFMQWQLRPGKSASAAVKKWLAGLTVAECLSTVRTLQLDALRATLGDDRFDELFGPVTGTPSKELLTIGLGDSTVTKFREKVGGGASDPEGTIGDRPAVVGGQYYFCNHPRYLLKHPAGAWQGENAVYLGKIGGVQMWSGFGANSVSEDGMYDEMVADYNQPRRPDDLLQLDRIKAANGGVLPPQYDPSSFPDQITKADALSAPAFTIDGTTRKGGFVKGGLILSTPAVGAVK